MNILNILYFLKDKKLKKDIYIKSYNRKIKIKDFMINNSLSFYNGKFFIPLYINKNMVNYLVNSFIFTKSILIKKIIKKYKKKKKKKNKK